MREALLIFRKDARRLRLELAAWFLLMGLHTWMEALLPARPILLRAVGLWSALLAPAAWYLVVALIHEERLPGDRQDWLTKPIPRSSLLLAKLLFLAVFLNVPLALSQMLSLLCNGLWLVDYGPVLIWRQIFFTALLVIPAAALAAVTESFAQFAIGLLAGYGGVLLLGLGARIFTQQDLPWGGIAWILTAVVAALALLISATVLLLAYLQRKTGLARLVLAGGVLLCGLLPAIGLWPVAFNLQRRLSGQPADAAEVRLSFDAARDAALGRGILAHSDLDSVRVAIPIAVHGIPVGAELLGERVETTIIGAGGISWCSGWRTVGGTLRQRDGWWQYLQIDPALFEKVRNHAVRLHTRAALTLFGPARVARLPVPVANRFVPNVGFCWAMPDRVQCFAPYRHAVRVAIYSRSYRTGDSADLGIRPDISYAPYSTGFGFGLWVTDIDAMPLKDLSDSELVIESREPLAHIERDLDIPSIRLWEYQDKPGAVR